MYVQSNDAGRDDPGRRSIALYSHDGFGLGHLSRSIHLAHCIRALEPGANILIITSSSAVRYLALPDEFEYIKLPSVTKTGTERYRPHLEASLETVVALRSALLLTTVQQLRPALFYVDHRPLGLKGEVLPTLQWIRQHAPQIRTVIGLRDVVDEAATVVREWKAQGIYHALEHLYDAVLIFGERSVLDSTREYDLPESVARKAQFTGYLGRGPARRSRLEVRRSLGVDAGRLIVVHAGGGGDGVALIETYLESAERLPEDVHSLVVAGPLMSRAECERLRRQALKLPVSFVPYQDDLAGSIAAADLSVSMAGYNTMCEVLEAGVRALVVPRVFPRQEQYIRAQRFAARGLVDVLLPTALNPGTLAERIRASLTSRPAMCQPVSLDGGIRAARIVSTILSRDGDGPSHVVRETRTGRVVRDRPHTRCLVTGAAGFVGSHLCDRLLAAGHEVVGIDSLTDYYARVDKLRNIERALAHPRFRLHETDLLSASLADLLDGVEVVFHLAAQAGVRSSWGSQFDVYTRCNVLATQRLLEACRGRDHLRRFVYASSSSVYGAARTLPIAESAPTQPVSPYGVTKLAGEQLCVLYHVNFGVPTVMLRYFTVYGARQRPDMAFHRFIRAALLGEPVAVHEDGCQTRDFTYVSDIVEANLLAARPAVPSGGVYNVGGGSRVALNHVLKLIGDLTRGELRIEYAPKQAGDLRDTYADITRARQVLGYAPSTSLEAGLRDEIEWYRNVKMPLAARQGVGVA